jgi:hypothetical protein
MLYGSTHNSALSKFMLEVFCTLFYKKLLPWRYCTLPYGVIALYHGVIALYHMALLHVTMALLHFTLSQPHAQSILFEPDSHQSSMDFHT